MQREVVTFRNGDELEAEADTFAAYLLMPLDDFRRQIPADADPALDNLSAAAERYGVSLIACVLRWLEYTTRHSKSGASPTSAWRAPAFVWASGTPPSDTATTSGPGRALALQFAHPHGHESKYAPIITRQRKEPCP